MSYNREVEELCCFTFQQKGAYLKVRFQEEYAFEHDGCAMLVEYIQGFVKQGICWSILEFIIEIYVI